jgi:hypothetical protein
MLPSPVTAFAFRLPPGADLKRELLAVAAARNWRAAAILTCVGSLSAYCLRFADRRDSVTRAGPFEIVSLVGTLSASAAHLHIGLADADGATVGGHVLDGCVIRTTAELVVAELPAVAFHRAPDPATGYDELAVRPRDG